MTHPDQTFFHERGFGGAIGFGRRPAVIVVDLLKGFTDPKFPLGCNVDAVVEATSELLVAARAAQVPIFHTLVEYEDDVRDAAVWALKLTSLRSMIRGSEATEFDPRIDRLPGESVVSKKYASAFFGTDLVSRLNALAVDTLVIAGCTTSGCVRATAVDAIQYCYRPIVVREAVGDRAQAAHEQSLFDLEHKYADVVGLPEVRTHLGSVGRPLPYGR